MAKRSVIVRRMAAVEGLGSCTVIASDKTGTLTVNRQTLEAIWLPDVGEVSAEDVVQNRVFPHGALAFARAAVAASEAVEVEDGEGDIRVLGDPVDAAFLRFGQALGVDPAAVGARVVGRIPYESERRYAAAVAAEPHAPGERPMVALKGAVEVVLDRAVSVAGPEGPVPIDRERVNAAFLALSAGGYRVSRSPRGRSQRAWTRRTSTRSRSRRSRSSALPGSSTRSGPTRSTRSRSAGGPASAC